MIRDKYLDIRKITTDPGIMKIFDIIHNHGGSVRFVGGAVRDAIVGKKGFDIDFSTDLSPDELAEACEDVGVKTVPIGLKFGTLGVLLNGTLLEVTSLRKDIKTDGRHAEVEFTDNWEEDAARRDLTINAVYADEQGNVFDYYNGISDLEKGIVRFIGNPEQRIREDYLRILRFFRFYSLFAKTPIDEKALKACIDNREGLEKVSIERIRDELIKIILTPNASKTLGIMFKSNLLGNWLADSDYLSNLDFLIRLEESAGVAPNSLRRFFVLYFPDRSLAENIAIRMHMSKNQKEKMIKWSNTEIGLENLLEETLRMKTLFRFGKEFCIDKLLIEAARNQIVPDNLSGIIEEIQKTEIPVFPISGKDILENKQIEDTQIGAVLDRLKECWIDSNFSLSKDSLLQKI